MSEAPPVGITWVDVSVPGTCPAVYVITRTFTLTDANGTTATGTQTITVNDDDAPVFTICPKDTVVACDALFNQEKEQASATDNCTAANEISITTDETENMGYMGACPSDFQLFRTWIAEDLCGNSSICSQTVTVVDTVAPTLKPASTLPGGDEGNVCKANAPPAPDADDIAALYEDNCQNEAGDVMAELVSELVTGTDCSWTATYTYSVSDGCNTTSAVVVYTGGDTGDPTFTVPNDITILRGAGCTYSVLPAATGDVTDEADNCATVLDATYTDGANIPGSCPSNFSFVRTWSLTDGCNTATATQNIAVADSTAPYFTTAATDLTVECDINNNITARVGWVIANQTNVAGADSCGSVTRTFTAPTFTPGCGLTGVWKQVYTLTDQCGNVMRDTATFTIIDTDAPDFTSVPNDTLLDCLETIPDPVQVTAQDICGNVLTTATLTETDNQGAPGTCDFYTYEIFRTYTAEDQCGNQEIHTQTITIVDDTAPSWQAGMPVDETVECDAVPDADTYTATDDFSGGIGYDYVEVRTNGTCDDTYKLTRTWTATDICGNTAYHTQTINVQDTTDPTWTSSLPSDDTVECSSIPAQPLMSAIDNCDGSVSITLDTVVTTGNCQGAFIIVRTWTAEDNCGNSIQYTQELTIKDGTAPTFTAPADKTIYADASCNYNALPAVTGNVTDATDNCFGMPVATYDDDIQLGNCEGEVIITRTWSLADDCGNAALDQVQVITVLDTISPTFTRPVDITIYTDANCSYDATVSKTGDVTNEADNCTSTLEATFSDNTVPGTCVGEWVITRTWSLEDDCGNAAANQVQTITVRDTITPTFTRPADITIYAGANCAYDSTVAVTGDVTNEADNCSTNLNATRSDVVTAGTCPGQWTITRTWSLEDDCGNAAANQVQTITVLDTITPTFTRPIDVTIFTDASCDYDATVTATGDVTDETDNCSTGLIATFSDATTLGSCTGEVVITRTWSLVDGCGNAAATQVQTITVQDNTPPTFTRPIDVTIFAGADCSYDASTSATGDVTNEADNCSTGLNATYSDDTQAGGCTGSWVIMRTWSLVDDCENSASTQVQTITVVDNTDPSWSQTMPGDVTVQCNAVPAPASPIAATDNCDLSVTVNLVADTTAGSCTDAYTITRTWTATDDCGNDIIHTQTITVIDNTAPTWNQTMPVSVTVECDAVPAVPSPISAGDNCDISVNVVLVADTTVGSCPDTYTITRTWTATDNCGNAITHTQTINVQDTTDPTWDQTMPASVTVACDSVPTAATITASDNCDTAVDVAFTDIRTDGNCAYNYTLTRTWTATDNCGHAITHTQVITVQDTKAPTFTRPVDITIYVDASCNYIADTTVTGAPSDEADNCAPVLNATYADVTVAGACDGAWTITRTWSLVDSCGNAASDQVQTITVQDSIKPVFSPAPLDVTAECDGAGNFAAVLSWRNNNQASVAGTDNCGTATRTVETPFWVQACGNSGTWKQVFKLTDDCGNVAIDTAYFVITDVTPPAAIFVPNDTLLQCHQAIPPAATSTFVDVCSGITSSFFDEASTRNPADSLCGNNEYTITRTWTAEDGCGNIATGTQVLTIRDTNPPTWSQQMPVDDTVECDAVPAPFAPVAATDLCDSNVKITFTQDSTKLADNSLCGFYNYTITRTWVAEDNCGNKTTHTQVITVEDTTIPTFTRPADITIYKGDACVYDADTTYTGDVTNELDNCDSRLQATWSDVTAPGSCLGETIITRTWSLEDACGNSAATQVQTITVADTVAPVFTVLPTQDTILCDGSGNTNEVVDWVLTNQTQVAATDNCSGVSVVYTNYAFTPDCGSQGVWTQTYTATDSCGNVSIALARLVVLDTVGPVFTSFPADYSISCEDPYPPFVSVTAQDLCSGGISITTFPDSVTQNANTMDCGNYSYSIIRRWIAFDVCGNQTPGEQIITVNDITGPTWDDPMPADLTISCDAVIPTADEMPPASDNCTDDVTVTYDPVSTQGNDPMACGYYNYTITRTWTAEDLCGNQTTHTQVITVEDTQAPTFTRPVDFTISADATCLFNADVTITGDVTDEMDNCTPSLNATFTDSSVSGACIGQVIISRTWTLTDLCNNTAATQVQTITVVDNTAPTWDQTMPADETVSCDSIPQYTVTASDNCDPTVGTITPSVVNTQNVSPAACGHYNYTITRTWVAEDDCGNAITHTQVVTVRDTIDPVFATVPAAVTVECSDIPSVGTPTATDNCAAAADISISYDGETRDDGNCADNFTLTRTWTATDPCGNTVTATQVITVQDTTVPTFTSVPAAVTVECSSIPAPGLPTASDNCDTLGVTITYLGESRTDGNCADNFTLTRTWQAEDNCGNSATASQVITVVDTSVPTFTFVPSDETVECSMIPDPGMPTATDNCDTLLGVTITYLGQDTTAGSCTDNFVLTRTWQAEDNCGNTATATQVITVQDTTDPIWSQTMPGDTLVNCDAVPVVPTIQASDNCDGAVTVTYGAVSTQDSLNLSNCANASYVITRTWVAEDNCGNDIVHTQTITVQDTTKPVFNTLPTDVTAACDGSGNFLAVAEWIESNLANVDVSDNCDIDVSLTNSPYAWVQDCGAAGVYTIVFTATDNCGNVTTEEATYTIIDTLAPVFTFVPDDITLDCTQPIPMATMATAEDLCSGVTTTFVGEVVNQNPNPNDCAFYSYTIVRTWLASDPCGNSSSATQTVTVQDIVPPTWDQTMPANVTIECDQSIPAVDPGPFTATDICDVNPLTYTFNEVTVPGTCGETYEIKRTWTATDICGNANSHTQTITIRDIVAPTWTTPAGDLDRTVECSDAAALAAAQALEPVASDNCDSPLTPVKTPGSLVTVSCPQAGTITNTWTVTDECGNTSTVYTQVITVTDNTVPTWTTAAGALDRTVTCEDATGLADAQSLFPVASDNCDNDVTNIVKTSGIFVAGSCPQAGTYTNTWTVTDDCGNTSTVYTQVITVTDLTAPIWSTPDGDLDRTVECSDAAALTAAQALAPVATDCDNSLTPVKTAGAFVAGSCPQAGTYTNTWTVTDDCGNTSVVYTQVITVTDLTAPTWTTAAGDLDATVSCDDAAALSAAQALAPVATDNCDNSLTPVKTAGAFVAGSCPQAGTYTNTWTVTDDCGNTSVVYTQVITVTDNVAPTWTTAAGALDRTVTCEDASGLAAAQALFPVASDNCDNDVTDIVKVSGNFVPAMNCPQGGTYTNTWTVTDDCGNTSVVYTQVITVTDNAAPTWVTAPGALDVTLECSDATGIANAQSQAPVATDNCDNDLTPVKIAGAFDDASCQQAGTYTNTWTVTDDCGNTSTVYTQVITLIDTQAPVLNGVPADETVECSSVPAPAAVTATDNCDTDVVPVLTETTTKSNDPNACGFMNYTITRTWVAQDDCGNATTSTQVITVQDTQAPTWDSGMPANAVVECDEVPTVLIYTASDNCDANVTVTYTQIQTNGSCPENYTLTRTWVATDNCGNAITHTQSITVQDTEAPTWSQPMPGDTLLECNLVFPGASYNATDDCDNDVTVTYGEFRTDGNCPYNYVLTRKWTAVDNCGNETVHAQTVTVQDTQSPTWNQSMPANVTVQCDAVPAPLMPVTASDNCDTDVVVSFTEVTTNGNCTDNYTLTRTWTATDDCGNKTTHTQVITVQDTQAPTWVNDPLPADATVECNAIPAVPVMTAIDNCDLIVSVTLDTLVLPGNCADNYTIIRSWTAMDNCGNAVAHVQTLTVRDTQVPVWSQGMPANVTVECDAVPDPALPINATDNCDVDVSVTYNQVRTDGNCTDNYTLTRTWIATDNCGNAITHTQTITVQDIQVPVWSQGMPANVTVECDAVPDPALPINATDNCDADVSVTYNQVRTDGNCLDNYTLTRTWIATDNCGNAITHIQVITVQDTQVPVWSQSMPANTTVECDDVPVEPSVSATDNCDANVTVTFTETPNSNGCTHNYTLTRTWVATDNCGNAITHTQEIMVIDTVAPTWDQQMPGDFSIECQDVLPPPPSITASDNCDQMVTVSFEEEIVSVLCPDSYVMHRTWTATDDCGNSITHLQEIKVRDIQAPVFTFVPADETVECDAVPSVGTPMATDNCDPSVTITYVGEVRTDGICTDSYTLTRTWTAEDNCGRISTATQVITVQDTQAPTFTFVPADETVECDAIPGVGSPTATDNCDTSVTITYDGEVRTDGSCDDNYTLARTWTATDNCGNSTTAMQVITVRDTQVPVFTFVPANTTVECNAIPGVGTPTATDNCDAAVTITYDGEVRTDGNCDDNYTLTRTWTATDNCGNSTAAMQVITVQDTQAPTFTSVPANVTVECDAVPTAGTPTATDNCDAAVTILYNGEVRTDGSCDDSYTLTRTWTATDNCGNSTTAMQVITVQDTQAPTFTSVPANVTVECDAVPAAGTPTATDNCDASVTITYDGEVRTDGSCDDSYTLTRTWTATDNCGNSTIAMQVITVQDTQAPAFTFVPANVTVECDAVPAAGTPTATDNCDASVTITYDGEVRTDGNCEYNYTLTRTWTATDNCGNSTTAMQVITVQDTQAPTWSQGMPANVTVECNAVPVAAAPINATDNCDGVTVTYNEVQTAGSCDDSYTLTRTWVAGDNCGNQTTHTQVITVRDTQAPTWSQSMPMNVTVECNAVPAAAAPINATDNCDANVAVTYNEVQTAGSCDDSYTLTRTWIAEDNCGNKTTHVQVITVQDTQAPTWSQSMPANVTVECNAVPAAAALINATDNCDANVTVTFTEVQSAGSCPDGYTVTRTWVAEDNCGNLTTHVQVITVRDTEAPTWNQAMPDHITVQCNAVPSALSPVTASDNCDANVTVTYTQVQTNGSCDYNYTLTRTWVAEDNCGNKTTHTQVVTVQDTEAPTLVGTLPGITGINSCSAQAPEAPSTADIATFYTDNCSGSVQVSYIGVTENINSCTWSVTYTYAVSDECGNTTSALVVFSGGDMTPPVLASSNEGQAISVRINANVRCFEIIWVAPPTPLPTTYVYQGAVYALEFGNGTAGDPAIYVDVTFNGGCGNYFPFTGELTIDGKTFEYINGGPAPLPSTWSCSDLDQEEVNECLNVADDFDATVWESTIAANYTDACNTVVVDLDEVIPGANNTDCAWTFTYVFEISDGCGNAIYCSVVRSGGDAGSSPPVLTGTLPGGDLGNVCKNDVTAPATGLIAAQYTDNCGTVNATLINSNVTGTDCGWTAVYTYSIEDACGNAAPNAVVTFTGADSGNPTWNQSMPASVTVECNAVPAPASPITASDNCDPNVTVTFTETSTKGADQNACTFMNYTLTRTWVATDDCGNAITHTQVITVIDTQAPTWSQGMPANVTVQCNAVPAPASPITASDNCDPNVTVTFTEVSTKSADQNACAFMNYTLTRTWVAEDNCGNKTTHTQVITVIDTQAPTWNQGMPANVTVQCNAVPAPASPITASDNCDPNVTVTFTETSTKSADQNACAFMNYTLTRTWVATDNCGNAITHTQVITVIDTQAPTWNQSMPANTTVQCNAVPAPASPITASDNCDPNVTVTFTETSTKSADQNACAFMSYTLTRRWTATDNCGNAITHTQVITVIDTQAPTWNQAMPANTTVQCDAVPPPASPITASDNCDPSVTVTFTETSTKSADQNACAFMSYTLTRRWTATDNCGNAITHTQVITVIDTQAPTWNQVMPTNATVECNAVPNVPVIGANDNCDPNVTVTFTEVSTKSNDQNACAFMNYTLTRTWVATDNCGNATTHTQVITVRDTQKPIMACKDVTVYVDASGNASITVLSILVNASDNCDPNVALSASKTSFNCADKGKNTVFLFGTDNCGNVGTCEAKVTVLDTIMPTWTFVPADVTVLCTESGVKDVPLAADNCPGVQVNLYSETQELWPAGPKDSYLVKRTWYALDASGNTIYYTQTIYVRADGELVVICNPDIVTQETNIPIRVDWPVPYVDDACNSKVEMTQIGGPLPNSFFNPGSETIITYEYVDGFGIHYQCAFWVIVPTDSSDYVLLLNEQDCENLQLTNCQVNDLPAPDNYSFEWISSSMTTIIHDLETSGQFETFADGSARLRGSWTNMANTAGWDVDIRLYRRRSHDGWVAAGGNIANAGLGNPETWFFYEVDATRSTMTGTGLNAGQEYNVSISPNFPNNGFQLGNGANQKTTTNGGWMIVGIRNKATENLIAQGIFSFTLNCQNTNRLKDAAEVISLDGFNYPVKWSNGVNGNQLGDVPAGQYSVTITDQGGKDSIATFILNLPTNCEPLFENQCRPGSVSEGGKAKQVSTLGNAVASRAIDGNTDGDFANGSVSSTIEGTRNWWMLDLQDETNIEFIRIWNRTDCCSDVLDPFWVLVSEAPIPQYGEPDSLALLPGVTAYYHEGPVADFVDIAFQGKGRYVKIQLDQYGKLALAEVEVMVCQDDKVGIDTDAFNDGEEEAEVNAKEEEQIPQVTPWPNPANSMMQLTVEQEDAQPVTISVMNLQGAEMYRVQLPAEKLHKLTLDTGSWAPGTYFITTTSPVGARSQQVTIQR